MRHTVQAECWTTAGEGAEKGKLGSTLNKMKDEFFPKILSSVKPECPKV